MANTLHTHEVVMNLISCLHCTMAAYYVRVHTCHARAHAGLAKRFGGSY